MLVLKFPYLIKHLKKPQPLFVEKVFFHAAALFHILFNYRGKSNAVIICWSDFLEMVCFQDFFLNMVRKWSVFSSKLPALTILYK